MPPVVAALVDTDRVRVFLEGVPKFRSKYAFIPVIPIVVVSSVTSQLILAIVSLFDTKTLDSSQ